MTARSRTKTASGLATSTMKSEHSDTIRAFATLRFAGERLDPDQISQLLHIQPTKVTRKNGNGRYTIWYLSTDKLIPGNDLMDHVGFLLYLLFPAPGDLHRLITLRDLLKRKNLESHVTCFWHGKSRARKPVVPEVVRKLFELISADLQIDFDAEE
jgi:uncharacterized protein DUF4279